MSKIVIVGASSGPGRLLFERLRDEGETIFGIARSDRGLTESANATFSHTDATDPTQLSQLISAEDTLIHCSKPEILAAFLETKPQINRLIALGSTRVYTAYPDNKYRQLKRLETAIAESGVDTTLLHPTMIYGAPGLNNIERIIKMAGISPVIPLPQNGESLIQPIHAEDVVNAICACLRDESTSGKTITLPGPSPMTYREFVETCIAKSGKSCRVVSLAYPLLALGAVFTVVVPGIPRISQDEVRRLLEDKAFDVTEMIEQLGVEPRTFATGINQIQL